MAEQIGFIGLGVMGLPMARNLRRAGYPLAVHDRAPGRARALIAAGATAAASARAAAAGSEVVVTMLPDGPDVEAVVLGPGGVLAGARPGTLLVEMSTIAPAVARRVAAEAARRGVRMLDAPVSGGAAGAAAGTLAIMVGGAAEDLARARPVLEVLGGTLAHCGASGAGQVAKACNQVAVAGILGVLAEALVLGARAGLAPEALIGLLQGGAARTRLLDLHGPALLARDFTPGFTVRLQRKDLRIALETGRGAGVPLPLTEPPEVHRGPLGVNRRLHRPAETLARNSIRPGLRRLSARRPRDDRAHRPGATWPGALHDLSPPPGRPPPLRPARAAAGNAGG